jgi:trehalose synthase
MLQLVDVGIHHLNRYLPIIGREEADQIRKEAEGLKGARVLQLNATPYGGGVSELLRSLVPLECDLGLKVDWRVIAGGSAFFKITKQMHNALQGGEVPLTKEDQERYLGDSARNADLMESDYDLIVVHDPQPAALRYYDAHIFTLAEFIPPDLHSKKIETMRPAIDPLSPKNMDLPLEVCRGLLNWIGIPEGPPLITQVSRFDPWKDPLGVIAAYYLVKKEIPDAHLALVGSMALDDPEGWEIYSQIMEYDQRDPNIHLLTNLTGVGDMQVNSFQRLSDVIVQKSIREGFGLVISEALWKEAPVVAGKAGGIPIQLRGGGGFLISSIEEAAEKILTLLQNRKLAEEEGKKGKEYVRKHFLITRLLKEEIALFRALLK